MEINQNQLDFLDALHAEQYPAGFLLEVDGSARVGAAKHIEVSAAEVMECERAGYVLIVAAFATLMDAGRDLVLYDRNVVRTNMDIRLQECRKVWARQNAAKTIGDGVTQD